jgi:4-diphosphocytidyl-2-C-methyl-D-erythritol kinase
LQTGPALATGRGEVIQPLEAFPAMRGICFVLVHPGFGISTPWAYQQLANFPAAAHGTPGRAQRLIALLQTSVAVAAAEFYNSLEASALRKYPLLVLFQEFFRENGAPVTLMSGSGSATFALTPTRDAAEKMLEKFRGKFGPNFWTAVVPATDA